jgi:biopolymer transport protein ExbB
MSNLRPFFLAVLLPLAFAGAQDRVDTAVGDVQRDLRASLDELAELRHRIASERLPLAQRLRELEQTLLDTRAEFQSVSRQLDASTLDLTALRNEAEQRRNQSTYLANLLSEYARNFESRLQIADLQRHGKVLETARLAAEDPQLGEATLFGHRLDVAELSLTHFEDALGGARFEGSAVADGVVSPGTFVQIGPTAVFRSADGRTIGAVTERTGSKTPTVVPFREPEDLAAVAQLALGTGGAFPLDATLGNAQKFEALEETWLEHVQKGGPVMVPIFVLAGAALLVVLVKWLTMMLVRRPAKAQMNQLLDLVDAGDNTAAAEHAATLPGPAGRMLRAGADHLGEPRDLVEEVMYEQVLSTRLSLQAWLPFVAICSTSAPLLGLLGTVTGIMKTFALMTEGAGDPKMLSSGISEALITTEYGLVVAIPSLLLHAFLSRKAKAIVDEMEKRALQFLNRIHNGTTLPDEPVVEVA